MPQQPKNVRIRTYQVGFGDCFLLTFCYDDEQERFVLLDFGSTSKPKEGYKKTLMVDIAKDIKEKCGGKLDAVIVTHRHRDHLGGFKTNKRGTGSGDIIASCMPDTVIRPWTEAPDAAEDAVSPLINEQSIAFSNRMHNMQAAAFNAKDFGQHITRVSSLKPWRDQISFVGELNVPNVDAIRNLNKMAAKGSAHYVHYGSESGLDTILPGVTSHVLGPPTIEQHEQVRKQRSRDNDEFWMLQASAGRFVKGVKSKKKKRLFLDYEAVSLMKDATPDVLWFIRKMKETYTQSSLELVTSVDNAINNTSIILLLEVGSKKLLFSGDAQIENWEYALKFADDHEKNMVLLSDVDVYKVGHHGSRNATPKRLYKNFTKAKADGDKSGKMKTINSTLSGHHGSESKHTEVPRISLVKKLEKETDYFTTESLKNGELSHELILEV